jgi:hypothetical protein
MVPPPRLQRTTLQHSTSHRLRVWVPVAAAARGHGLHGVRGGGWYAIRVRTTSFTPGSVLLRVGERWGGAPRGLRLTPAVRGGVRRAGARAGRTSCTEALLGRRTQHRVRSESAPARVERVRCATASSECGTHQSVRMYVQRRPRCAWHVIGWLQSRRPTSSILVGRRLRTANPATTVCEQACALLPYTRRFQRATEPARANRGEHGRFAHVWGWTAVSDSSQRGAAVVPPRRTLPG